MPPAALVFRLEADPNAAPPIAASVDCSFRRRVAAPHVDNIDSQTFLSFELFYGGMRAQEVSHA